MTNPERANEVVGGQTAICDQEKERHCHPAIPAWFSVACFSLSRNRVIFSGRRQVYRQRAARDAAVEQSIRDVIRLTSRKCRAQRFLASRNLGRWATFRDILDKSCASSTSGHRGGSPSANRIVRFGAFGADSRNIPQKVMLVYSQKCETTPKIPRLD